MLETNADEPVLETNAERVDAAAAAADRHPSGLDASAFAAPGPAWAFESPTHCRRRTAGNRPARFDEAPAACAAEAPCRSHPLTVEERRRRQDAAYEYGASSDVARRVSRAKPQYNARKRPDRERRNNETGAPLRNWIQTRK